MVNNLPAMRETRLWSLGHEDPLEKEMATHSSILAWRIPQTEEFGRVCSWGHKESVTTERLTLPIWETGKFLLEMFMMAENTAGKDKRPISSRSHTGTLLPSSPTLALDLPESRWMSHREVAHRCHLLPYEMGSVWACTLPVGLNWIC